MKSGSLAEFLRTRRGLEFARCTVATLRRAAGPQPYSPQMSDLIEELSVRSDPDLQLWIYQAEPGSASECAVRRLGELATAP